MNRARRRLEWWSRKATGIAFDALHGVDTGAGVAELELDISAGNRRYAIPYDPSHWRDLSRTLQLASLPVEGFNFIDVGCGKGKVLLSALRYPFARIVGIEFSPHLCHVAKRNLADARFVRRRCTDVEIVCADAVEYPVPEQPTVFFFYNPFTYEVMEKVLMNIVRSFLQSRRSIYVIVCGSPSNLQIDEFLCRETGGSARRRASGISGRRTVVVFEMVPQQRCRDPSCHP
jgi:SAM-dependent methyltransferase